MNADKMASAKKFLSTNAFITILSVSSSISSASAFGLLPSSSSSTPMPMPMPMLMLMSTKAITTNVGAFNYPQKGLNRSMTRKFFCRKDSFTLYYRDDDNGDQRDDTTINTPTTEGNTDAPIPNLQSSNEDTKLQENRTSTSGKNSFMEQVERLYNSVINRNNSNEQQSNGKILPLPVMVQDTSLLYYDVFLILNLTVSISFWVVHRMSLYCIMDAFNEGCLLSILWIASGLYNGSFLYSAADGHYDMTKVENLDKGGPKAAGLLGLWTFVGTINLRMVVALCLAVLEHRPVGVADGEELIPLELCFGLVLMSMWRMLHSAYTRV